MREKAPLTVDAYYEDSRPSIEPKENTGGMSGEQLKALAMLSRVPDTTYVLLRLSLVECHSSSRGNLARSLARIPR